jgi:hypothetical protein
MIHNALKRSYFHLLFLYFSFVFKYFSRLQISNFITRRQILLVIILDKNVFKPYFTKENNYFSTFDAEVYCASYMVSDSLHCDLFQEEKNENT